MIIPSFSGYAAKPDLGGSYLGGVRIAQAAQQANQEIQLGRERIAAQQQQAAMELQAKQQVEQQNALRRDQELQIEKAQKEAVLGMEQRRLDEAAKITQMKIGQAAQKFQAQQQFQKESADLIAGGMDANEAYSQTALKYGPQLGIPGSAYTRAGVKSPMNFGEAQDVPGLPEGFKQVQTGLGSRRIIKIPDAVKPDEQASDIPGLPGKKLFRGKVYTDQETADEKAVRSRLKSLESAQDKDPAKGFAADAADGVQLSKSKKIMADAYNARAQEISTLRSQLKGGNKSAAAPFEGKKVRNKKTGEIGRIVDGEFVPDKEDDSGSDTEE